MIPRVPVRPINPDLEADKAYRASTWWYNLARQIYEVSVGWASWPRIHAVLFWLGERAEHEGDMWMQAGIKWDLRTAQWKQGNARDE